MANRAWVLLTMGANQQYAGNRGYRDDTGSIYRYDSNVANSRALQAGDLVVLRNSERMLGIAQIERIEQKPATKIMLRCPECSTTALKERQNKRPRFRCQRGHEFEKPLEDVKNVTAFQAHYEHSFVSVPDAIPVADLKAEALRPSDQLSIEEIEVPQIEHALISANPQVRDLLGVFVQLADPDKPALPFEDGKSLDESQSQTSYTVSPSDSRNSVLRSIRERRGQAAFRSALLQKFKGRCAITGCGFAEVLEAAHIWPYRGTRDNHPENGLLLRGDIHTLYDLDLIAIDPATQCIVIASTLPGVEPYAALSGHELCMPATVHLSPDALRHRWKVFEAKWLHVR